MDYSESNECDAKTGECPCKENMKGMKCIEPQEGYCTPEKGQTKGNSSAYLLCFFKNMANNRFFFRM